jgi:hypothetical protein
MSGGRLACTSLFVAKRGIRLYFRIHHWKSRLARRIVCDQNMTELVITWIAAATALTIGGFSVYKDHQPYVPGNTKDH